MRKITRKKTNPVYLLAVVSVVSLFILAYQSLTIRHIDCFSQFGPCPDDISKQLSPFLGTLLLKTLPVNQVKKSLTSFPQIRSVSLYRRLPSTLVIALSLRKPIGAVGPTVLGAQSIADEDGFVFQKISQSALPTLITPNLPPISSRLSAGQLQSLVSLNLVSDLFDTQVSGVLDNNTLTISAPNDLKVIVNIAQPTSNWYTPLQLIMHRSKINAKMPHKIDLRFDNSVITY
jgi:cell division septal protein FtsQ